MSARPTPACPTPACPTPAGLGPAARSRRTSPLLAGPLLAGALLAGCTDLLPGQGAPSTLYTLSPKTTVAATVKPVRWQLVVERPLAAAGLDSQRIALKPTALTMDYFGGANWLGPAPDVVQTLVIESFETSGRIAAIGRAATGLRADYVLNLELRDFQAEYDAAGQPRVAVRLNAKLVAMPERVIIGSLTAGDTAAATADRVQDIVLAFDTALAATLKQLVEWTLTTPGRR